MKTAERGRRTGCSGVDRPAEKLDCTARRSFFCFPLSGDSRQEEFFSGRIAEGEAVGNGPPAFPFNPPPTSVDLAEDPAPRFALRRYAALPKRA